MKKICLMLMVLVSTTMAAQTEKFEQRYNLLVSKLGPAGVGVETVLNNWEAVDSTDAKLLIAKYNFYIHKGLSTEIVTKSTKKYLGMDPVLQLKDSLNNTVYYYQENFYDDELFKKALDVLQKAISLYPDKLDFRFLKANAYIMYEKESPDMALEYLLSLAKEDASRERPWVYDGEKVDDAFFSDAMQEYCYNFYFIGSDNSMKAFKRLSEYMLDLNPKSYVFMNNIGSYYLVVESDYKTALKYYSKVLKKDAENQIALKNSSIAYRKLGKEKKAQEYYARWRKTENQ